MTDQILISTAGEDALTLIRNIAYKTWPAAYGAILSEAQISYMLELFYETEALQSNLENGHHFIIASKNDIALGFASYEHNYKNQSTTRIPKIYVLPEAQCQGIGRKLLDEITNLAKTQGDTKLSLNVNRNNLAQHFYRKLGFEISAEEDIQLAHGYVMEDYIMEKLLP